MSGPPDRSEPTAGAAQVGPGLLLALNRVAIWVLGTVFVVVALLGVLVSASPLLLVVVLVSAAGGAWLAQRVHRAIDPGSRAPLHTRVTAATATGLFFPFTTGTEVLGEDGSHLSAVVILLATLTGLHWIARLSRPPVPTGGPVPEPPDLDQSALPPLLQRLPLDDLLDEWRSRSAGPRIDGDTAIRARELLLEEIERRDPRGFRRWLREGLGGDPRPFIRGADPALPSAEHPDDPAAGR